MLRTCISIAPTVDRAVAARNSPPVLTASEIGAFVFCPQAWHLQRSGARQSATAEKRMDRGTRAHRKIGRDTDDTQAIEAVRRLLLLAILVLAVVLLARFSGLLPVPAA
ncbi:MAG TPA: hypothetical protein VGQ62_18960 [Chloroflexota bacterium]|jgi:hypothetical protein|nr:hypothetical protein [Chloroflexota bacterium]